MSRLRIFVLLWSVDTIKESKPHLQIWASVFEHTLFHDIHSLTFNFVIETIEKYGIYKAFAWWSASAIVAPGSLLRQLPHLILSPDRCWDGWTLHLLSLKKRVPHSNTIQWLFRLTSLFSVIRAVTSAKQSCTLNNHENPRICLRRTNNHHWELLCQNPVSHCNVIYVITSGHKAPIMAPFYIAVPHPPWILWSPYGQLVTRSTFRETLLWRMSTDWPNQGMSRVSYLYALLELRMLVLGVSRMKINQLVSMLAFGIW